MAMPFFGRPFTGDFGTFKGRNGSYSVIDPYGWHSTAADPWEIDPRGTASIWLWRDGEAPRLR